MQIFLFFRLSAGSWTLCFTQNKETFHLEHNSDAHVDWFIYATIFTIGALCQRNHRLELESYFSKWCRQPSSMSSVPYFIFLLSSGWGWTDHFSPGQKYRAPILPIPCLCLGWRDLSHVGVFLSHFIQREGWGSFLELNCVPHVFVWIALETDLHFQS